MRIRPVRVRAMVVGALLVAATTACAGPAARRDSPVPELANIHQCSSGELGDVGSDPAGVTPNVPVKIDFSCAQLDVPLDHGLLPGPRTHGRLTLDISMANNVDAPRGLLLFLVGGPGEPGVPLTADIASGFDPAVLRDYRLVFLSGRGTGEGALRCSALQTQLGSSDFAVPRPQAVTDCARDIGDKRQYFTSADMAADIDDLRLALGAEKISLDGASYGSYEAERYALAYPTHVTRLVLDSVVPQQGIDALARDVFARSVSVLRTVCQESHCVGDPVADVASVVRAQHRPEEVLDLLTGLSSGHPDIASALPALHQAASGQFTALDKTLDQNHRDSAASFEDLSQGLHTAMICQDQPAPWGNAATPVDTRASRLATVVAALPEADFFPFDRQTAAGNGQVATCENWPVSRLVPFDPDKSLPNVPVLLLAGDHDLNTPVSAAQRELAEAPDGHIVIVPGSGHITQDHANGPGGRTAVRNFLVP